MPSDRGFWNRASRRSGGDRPTQLVVPPVIACACGESAAFGMLPRVIVEGTECAQCPRCKGILMARIDGRWMTADKFSEPRA